MHPFFTEELARAHRDELLQQADASRLAAFACSSRVAASKSGSRRLRHACKGANNVRHLAYQ
jgi:hypothetical protein